MAVDPPPPRLPPAAVVRRTFAVRSRLKRLADRMLPSSALLAERMFAASEVKLLGVVCELGVPDQLDGGRRSSADVARELGLDADALERVLRHLASRGWLRRRRDATYSLNGRSRLLRADDPDSLRDWVRFMAADWHWEMWNRMPAVVSGGGSAAEAATGKGFFAWVHEDRPDAGTLFDGAMRSLSSLAGPTLARAVDLTGVRSICDVGGGTGRTLGALLVEAPTARGVVFDLPEVVSGAAEVLDPIAAGRWESEGGDFFDRLPGGHDRYVLQAVLHDWDDERCGQILANIRHAMPADGRVYVMDQVLDPDERDGLATAVDVLMLALADGGRERTQPEWEELFTRNGLVICGQVQLPILTWVFTLEAV